jgi:2-hydroxychromene-2-carboxylate isomerase
MTEKIRFHFDPGCPWAWQSAKWVREVATVRDIEVEWRLYSLALANNPNEDPLADAHAKGTAALRTLALVRQAAGNDGVGALYEAIGTRRHEQGEELNAETIRKSLVDAGFEEDLLERALADEGTLRTVISEHQTAVDEVGAFGVPTICLADGRGIFGPVVAVAPKGAEAGELWDHFRYFVSLDGFYEMKRTRDRKPGVQA